MPIRPGDRELLKTFLDSAGIAEHDYWFGRDSVRAAIDEVLRNAGITDEKLAASARRPASQIKGFKDNATQNINDAQQLGRWVKLLLDKAAEEGRIDRKSGKKSTGEIPPARKDIVVNPAAENGINMNICDAFGVPAHERPKYHSFKPHILLEILMGRITDIGLTRGDICSRIVPSIRPMELVPYENGNKPITIEFTGRLKAAITAAKAHHAELRKLFFDLMKVPGDEQSKYAGFDLPHTLNQFCRQFPGGVSALSERLGQKVSYVGNRVHGSISITRDFVELLAGVLSDPLGKAAPPPPPDGATGDRRSWVGRGQISAAEDKGRKK